MFVYGDVVMLKLGGIEPEKLLQYRATFRLSLSMSLHRMALVSFRLFRKNLGNLREFFGQMVYLPPPPQAKKRPYAHKD